ncbi:MOSC N-terminal beta barrel domain-containing protein [Aeropyrum camini]|uniref:MOSC N-terminal beta barrel domain-containing protein n=1 Tax=Aeropyrum camini TaxID=229980 RepID=UPI0007884710|nr:MOSC N-terminal beta barrel domain-containing protein [Aeropyrum camini]
MADTPFLYKILLYPIKSLPPVEVLEARVSRFGGLEWDRRLALVAGDGGFVNGKRERRLHLVRARFSLERGLVYLSACCGGEEVYSLEDLEGMSGWFSRFLGYPVRVVEDPAGFPDDVENPGPTVVSTATLAELAGWFGWDLMQARLRIRANLEVWSREPSGRTASTPAPGGGLFSGWARSSWRAGGCRLGVWCRPETPSQVPWSGGSRRGWRR